jgi:hypothetical protein
MEMVYRDTIHQGSDVRRLLEALVLQSSSFKDLEGSKEFLQAVKDHNVPVSLYENSVNKVRSDEADISNNTSEPEKHKSPQFQNSNIWIRFEDKFVFSK